MSGYYVGTVGWIYPCQEKPPSGVKISLLTIGNIQTTGIWRDDGSYKAWFPLLKQDKELEDRLGYRGGMVDRDKAKAVSALCELIIAGVGFPNE